MFLFKKKWASLANTIIMAGAADVSDYSTFTLWV